MIYGDAFHLQIYKGAGTMTTTTENKIPYTRPIKSDCN